MCKTTAVAANRVKHRTSIVSCSMKCWGAGLIHNVMVGCGSFGYRGRAHVSARARKMTHRCLKRGFSQLYSMFDDRSEKLPQTLLSREKKNPVEKIFIFLSKTTTKTRKCYLIILYVLLLLLLLSLYGGDHRPVKY